MRLFNYLNMAISQIDIAIADTHVREISYFGALIGGLVGALLGGFDDYLKALLIFMVIDYITGLMVGKQGNKLNSKIGFIGLKRKVTILIAVIVGSVVDRYILRDGEVFRTAVIFMYLSNEGISIIENCSKLGVPIPKKLQKILEQLNDNDDVDEVLKNDDEINKIFEEQNNENYEEKN